METKAILLLVLPVFSLVLLLGWVYLMVSRREKFTLHLAGFGVKFSLETDKRTPESTTPRDV